MSPFGIVLAGLINQSGRDLFHAENSLIKPRDLIVMFGMCCQMPDFRKHGVAPFSFGVGSF
jgi:hypothetical protein